MKHTRFLSIVCVIVYLALLSGCSKKEDDSSAETNADTELSAQVPTESVEESPKETSTIQSSTEGTLFKDVLALWEAEKKDEAVKKFLSIQWDNPSVFQGIQVLDVSDQEWKLLAQDEMKRVADESHELTIKMRKLMFYVSSIGDKHASSGDIQTAKEHFEAIRRYGEAFSQTESFDENIRKIGIAILAYGQKKLSEIELSAQVPTESVEESPKEGSTIMSRTEGTLFKDVLALWEAEQKDEAVKQFLSIQWDDPSIFQGIQALNMSEQDLRSLPQDEVKLIVGEALNLSSKMRKLVFYVVSIGDKHASSGDKIIAKEHFEAIRLFGEALSQSERFEIIKMVSKAIVSLGQKKLSEIE